MFGKREIENNEDVSTEEKDMDKELNELLDYFISNQSKKLNQLQNKNAKREIFKEIDKQLNKKRLSSNFIAELKEAFWNYVCGYGIIEELINNPSISDIKIISYDNVRAKMEGHRFTTNIKFKTEEEYLRFVNIVSIKNHINLADINACQTFTDKDTNKNFILRINITTGYINSTGTPYIHFRKIPKFKKTKEELIKQGLATEEEFDYLINRVREGKSIIFAGKGGSGKTTLMNFLIDMIPHDKAGLVIQENEELFSKTHPELMFQKVKISKGEGKIQYTLKDLSINGLLIDIDYFIIGEIKGAEAIYILNACYTGHTCMTSIHAENSREAHNKLVDYMKYESDYSREDLLRMMESIPIVVYNKNYRIQEISEVKGWDSQEKQLIYNTIFSSEKKIGKSIFEECEVCCI